MKKIIKVSGLMLFLFIIGGFASTQQCQAASATVNIEADSAEMTVGDNIFVYIKIDSSTLFGNFEANLTYDEDILEYSGGAAVITGGSGFLKISDMGVLEGEDTRKYTLKFKALKAGMCTFAFSGRAIVYDATTESEMSVSSNELTLNVKAPVSASTNANLKSLKISPSELTPSFDTKIFEYSANVSYDTEQLIITALSEDSKATVSIAGDDTLVEGENKVVVSVLAESGNVIEYTINVMKETSPEQNTTDEPSISPGAIQSSFEIVKIDGEQYAIFNGKYKLMEPNSDIAIPEGYQKGSVTLAGESVTAYLPINNGESEFLLLYMKNELGDSGFYRFDRVEKTLQRYVSDDILINGGGAKGSTDDNNMEKKYNSNLSKAAIVIALLTAFSGVLIFITIRLVLRLKGYKEDDLD